MSLHLSKSRYCAAIQCKKQLWLKVNKPDVVDESLIPQAVLDRGNAVGDLAMGLLGDFVEVPFGDLTEMCRQTEALIDNSTPVIAEASFAWEGLFCSVDLLRVLGKRRVEIVEVKSSTHVTPIYLEDVTFQTYVLERLGYDVQRVSIAHINTDYVLHGALELDKLFTLEDVTDIAREKQPEVEARIADLEVYMQTEDEPSEPIGGHCFNPYGCAFFPYCTRSLPKPNIFDISGLQTRTRLKNYDMGIISYEDIEVKKAVNANALLQVTHALHDLPPAIDRAAISRFLDGLAYPLYFLDFESFQPAIPLYDNSHPYEQIVFQYSLHCIESEGGVLQHHEFLAWPGEDPRRGVAEQLCRDIPKDVCVLVYNMSFEKGRIKALAELYPDLTGHLINIHDHIQDLMVPFQKKQYYTRAMQGSYSIKYVLPALFPEDPSLDYHRLEGVHNGAEASDTFSRMSDMEPDELQAARANLLKYCGLDTYAMVKVWQKLTEVTTDLQRKGC